MIWNDGFATGSGWHAWVRPRPQHDDWTWEAVCLSASTCWQSATTEDEARAAAMKWVRERAEDVAERAAAVLVEMPNE